MGPLLTMFYRYATADVFSRTGCSKAIPWPLFCVLQPLRF
jgi:hypothetical protein